MGEVVELFKPKVKPEFDFDQKCRQLVCNCGGEDMRAYYQNGLPYLVCASCDADQTHLFFEG